MHNLVFAHGGLKGLMGWAIALLASVALEGCMLSSSPPMVTLMSSPELNPATASVRLQPIILEAYEDQIPPLGVPSNASYPLGHAIVRLRLENLTQQPVMVDLQRIEIRSATNDDLIMELPLESIDLGGLQILEPGFHLTQAQGFRQTSSIRAVVIYEINGQSYRVDSPLFQITVNR